MPTKTWASGEAVIASDMNTYLQRQVVSTFATAASRDTAIPAPTAGMMCYQADIQGVQIYTTSWRTLPNGHLASAIATTDGPMSAGSTPTLMPAISGVTCTLPAGRRIKVSCRANVFCDAAQTLIRLQIREGSTVLMNAWTSSTSTQHMNIHSMVVLTPTGGTHTYDIYIYSDSGNAKYVAAPDSPATTIVEDIGV